MAAASGLLAYEVADLCLGKPALKSLSVSATIADALTALKASEENCISVWSCDHTKKNSFVNVNHKFGGGDDDSCVCIGKLCMVDIICYLCREDNLASPRSALKSPVSALLSAVHGQVRHVEPSSSLVEAIDLILQGAQNLVVPIKTRVTSSSKRKFLQKSSSSSITPTIHNGREFCWLTQEDVIRFLLNSIGLFSPIPTLSVERLGLISTDFSTIPYHCRASKATEAILDSLNNQTSVAVVDDDGILIGEISPFTLACCDETAAAAAIATLTAGDLMSYIDCGGPPEDIFRAVTERLKERNLLGMLEEFMTDTSPDSSSISSDDDLPSPNTNLISSGRYNRLSSYSARIVRRAEAIVCHPESSLVAVMMQAIAHRVSYVWVIEDDGSVVGIVTFPNILQVFREYLDSSPWV